MATYYIDPSATVNGSGTFGSPYNTWASAVWAAGNTYLQKGGTTQTGYRVFVTTGGSSEATRVIVGSYHPVTGERTTGGVYRARLNGAGTAQTIRVSSGVNFVTVDNFEIYGTDGTGGSRSHGVYFGNGATLPSNDIVLTNLWIHDISAALFPAQDNDAIQGFGDRARIQFCLIHDIPTDALWLQGSHYRITHNTIHTISTNDIKGDNIQTHGDVDLRNDYGYIAHNFLDHSNRNTKQVIIVGGIGFSTGALVEHNTCLMAAYDTIATTCIFSESSSATIRRNYCEGGYFGIFVNTSADDNTVEANVCVSNQRGLSCNSGIAGMLVYGNTVASAVLHGAYFDTAGLGNEVKNNVFTECAVGVALRVELARNYNAYYGNGTDFVALTGGGSIDVNKITTDPLLNGAYQPTAGSPLLGAGTHLGYTRDVAGKQRQNPPTIGAFDRANLRRAD